MYVISSETYRHAYRAKVLSSTRYLTALDDHR